MFYRLLLFFCLAQTLLSQTNYKTSTNEILYGVSIGYTNQSGNFGKVGVFYETIIFDKHFVKFDLNANLSKMRNQFSIIPEFGTTLYFLESQDLLAGTFIETEITPYTITPKVGLTIITLIDFGFGYGFEIQQKHDLKPIKGFQFSFGLNLPLNFNFY